MRLLARILALVLLPATAQGAPNCTKGKRCGNTCIAASKTCHVGTIVWSGPRGEVDAPGTEEDPVVPDEWPSEEGNAIEPRGVSDSATEPAPEVSPETRCHREDFEDFDAFVDCRFEAEQAHRSVTVQPTAAVNPVEAARQREVDEARAELTARTGKRASARAEQARQTRATVLGLVISGSLVDAAGLGLMAAAYIDGDTVSSGAGGGPMCTTGKRCGDTCIAVEFTCHTPTSGGSSIAPHPVLLWSGVATVALGTGLLVGALLFHRRNTPSASFLVNAKGVGFRF